MTIPAGSPRYTAPVTSTFLVGTFTASVIITQGIDTELWLLEKNPSDGGFYVVSSQSLAQQYPDGLLVAALNASGHPEVTTNLQAEQWLAGTNYAIGADVIKAWYVANVLPLAQTLIKTFYNIAPTAPPAGGTTLTSLGLFQYMLSATTVVVDLVAGTITLTAAF